MGEGKTEYKYHEKVIVRNMKREILERLGIAFRAGILYENDCDFPVAKALASEVITEKMFEPIGKDTFEAACRKIDESDYVIDTGCPVGQMNAMLKDVLEYAAEKKK